MADAFFLESLYASAFSKLRRSQMMLALKCLNNSYRVSHIKAHRAIFGTTRDWLMSVKSWQTYQRSEKFDSEFGCNVSFCLNLAVNDVSLIGLVHSTICCVCLCHITSRYILIPHANPRTKSCPNLVKGKIAILKTVFLISKIWQDCNGETQGENSVE